MSALTPPTPAPTHTPPPASQQEDEGGFSLDAVMTALKRFWWLVLLAAAAGGAIAWQVVARQPYTYQKTASVMMRDFRKNTAMTSERILSELGVNNGKTDLTNETIVLKSTTLMRRVVEKLGLSTTYWTREQFREIELYKDSPVSAMFDELPDHRGCAIDITPVDDVQFILSYQNNTEQPVRIEGRFAEAIQLPFARITVYSTPLMGEQWFGRTVTIRKQPVGTATRALLASLGVTYPHGANAAMLEIQLTSTNPHKAADVLNELIIAYNDQTLEEHRESFRKTQQFITTRLEELGSDLSETDETLTKTDPSGLAGDTATLLSAHYEAVRALDESITELKTEMELAAELARKLEGSKSHDGLISIDTGLADTSISARLEAYNTDYLEFCKIAGSAGERNPVVISLRNRMAATLMAAKHALESYRTNQQLKLTALENKKVELQSQLESKVARQRELSPILREHSVKEGLYILLLTKEQENALALYIAEPAARALEDAYGSDQPIAPDTRRFTIMGALAGGGLCLLCIIGLGMLDNKAKNKHDLEPYSSLPCVAELPQLTRREKKQGVFAKGSRSTMAESLHILRNNVDNLVPRTAGQATLMLFTSTLPNEGKTFIATHLATAFAHAGRRVLLIDGDLRKGSLTRELIGKGYRGLSTLLLRHAQKAEELIRPLPGAEGIDILPSGPLPPNPVTLLSQPLLGELLEQLRGQYDTILLDAPPHGILADTDLLAKQADLTLYVVRSGRVDKRYFSQVQRLAEKGSLPNPAYVLNDVNFKAGSYHYYGYHYYGGYRYHDGKEAEEPASPAS